MFMWLIMEEIKNSDDKDFQIVLAIPFVLAIAMFINGFPYWFPKKLKAIIVILFGVLILNFSKYGKMVKGIL